MSALDTYYLIQILFPCSEVDARLEELLKLLRLLIFAKYTRPSTCTEARVIVDCNCRPVTISSLTRPLWNWNTRLNSVLWSPEIISSISS
ncbi:hypothetical protein DPMN_169702 [Dreissena polymorpha]|uniref:Uncharacterized protein n=1 Tax=Dreissena polymorpha TaxID=45954 RepID=A0A9D4DV38_DREPO|nr:hypothetical protein DPMN_169702 [Dreissena polymorpha]